MPHLPPTSAVSKTTSGFAGFTCFVGGPSGSHPVQSVKAIVGDTLAGVERMDIALTPSMPGAHDRLDSGPGWRLVGVPSNVRYVETDERTALRERQAGLGRPEATVGVLIPISKSQEWWDLTQDARRAIFEEKSRHIADSLKYLPSIARQLYHARDLGGPFDFLTWFEFAPEHTPMFEELLLTLRRSEEWRYVNREVEVRVRLRG